MRSRFIRALQIGLMGILAAAGLTVTASPAMADTTCNFAGAVCVWTSPNYTGTRTVLQGWPCTQITGAANDNTSSLKVNASPASNDWILYVDSNCNPASGWITYNNGTSIASLNATYNNKFSSAGAAN